MAFREKILWSSLIATIVVWTCYYVGFLHTALDGSVIPGHELVRFVQAVVVMIVVQVLLAVFIAIVSRREAGKPADDRERGFALAAYRPAFLTLSGAVFTVLALTPWLVAHAPPTTFGGVPVGAAIVIMNALMFGIVSAELMRTAMQILYYRRGGIDGTQA